MVVDRSRAVVVAGSRSRAVAVIRDSSDRAVAAAAGTLVSRNRAVVAGRSPIGSRQYNEMNEEPGAIARLFLFARQTVFPKNIFVWGSRNLISSQIENGSVRQLVKPQAMSTSA